MLGLQPPLSHPHQSQGTPDPAPTLAVRRRPDLSTQTPSAQRYSAPAARPRLPSSSGRWRFGESDDGDGLETAISTELGYGLRVHLSFYCNDRGQLSLISSSSDTLGQNVEPEGYSLNYLEGDLYVETYRNGARTNRFSTTGYHPENGGDPVTVERLRAVGNSDMVLITGAARPIAFPSTSARTAIEQFIAACNVVRSIAPTR
jgi:hypothetical protein